ncbi:MAG: hypothetical protein KDE51_21635, partial [Anaerolineales bacterium]|nr:hypothetical protein [Anaerolineales bacterium]
MTTFIPKRSSAGKAAELKKTKSTYKPWLMLFSRLLLFATVQALLALTLYLSGLNMAWESAANWWPFTVTIANLICLALLIHIFHSENKNYWALFRMERKHIKGDMLAVLIFIVVSAPLAYFPNVWLGQWLFGRPEATLALFVRPLPLWAAYTSLFIFSISQRLPELATY